MKTDPGTIYSYIAHRHMNVEIGAEAALFPKKEYISGIFVAVHLPQHVNHDVYEWYPPLLFSPWRGPIKTFPLEGLDISGLGVRHC